MNPYSDELGLHKITNQAIDEVILEGLERDVEKAMNKTIESISRYRSIREVPGFNSDTLLDSPSFRHLYLGFLDQYFELCKMDEIKIPSIPHSETMTISDIVSQKYDKLESAYPVTYVLNKDVPKRPRFRKVNLDFFTKVNKRLDYFYPKHNAPIIDSLKLIAHKLENDVYNYMGDDTYDYE